MRLLTLSSANTIISAALDKGRELGLQPLSIAVLDSGGQLIAFQRQDGASNLRFAIARAKASGALGLGVSSRKIGAMSTERPVFVASLAALSEDGVVPAAGGVIILDPNGTALGAVGVTGDTSDNDEICAFAGISAAGFIAQAET